MTTTELLTPLELGTATKVGTRVFRKQILPLGEFAYKGRKLKFTKERLAGMAKAFQEAAFDAVPLVLAGKQNEHTMLPTAATGEVIGMETTDDGLDVIVQASEEAATLLSEHPNVGISARIIENLERADGKSWPDAIQHALITWDPRLTGMRPWQAVEMSTDVDETVDLSTLTFADSGDDTHREEMIEMAQKPLTDEEVEKVRALMALVDSAEEDTGDAGDGAEGDAEELEITDEELERIAAEAVAEVGDGAETGAEDGESGEGQEIAASGDNEALELANARLDEQALQLATLQAELDRKNFEAERDRFATEFGIPPAVTDLARPLLEGSHTIDLSNGDSVDAGKVMRDVLAEFGKQIKALDLSGEIGSQYESTADAAEAKEREEFVKRVRSEID